MTIMAHITKRHWYHAPNVKGYSDDVINDALDGELDAYGTF